MLRTWMKQARLLLATSLALNVAFANGDIGTYECRVVQLDAQETVTAGEPYRNLGQRNSTAARYIDAAISQEQITPDCAGCIISEFAKNTPIADQTPCGPLVGLKLDSVPSEIVLILGETKNLVTVVGIETNEVPPGSRDYVDAIGCHLGRNSGLSVF
jgi:hypothetical protein